MNILLELPGVLLVGVVGGLLATLLFWGGGMLLVALAQAIGALWWRLRISALRMTSREGK